MRPIYESVHCPRDACQCRISAVLSQVVSWSHVAMGRICVQDGTRGEVRSWAAMGADVLLMSMRGSRWCGNVGRHHRSNGIYYVVDLAAGTWWQKCFDSDCRHYRSEMMPLPPHVLPPASAATTPPSITSVSRFVICCGGFCFICITKMLLFMFLNLLRIYTAIYDTFLPRIG